MRFELGFNRWGHMLILFIIVLILWGIIYYPCSISDQVAEEAAYTICNELELSCSGDPIIDVTTSNSKEVEFIDASYYIHCSSNELDRYSFKSLGLLNSVADKMPDSDELITKLDKYIKFFDLQDALLSESVTKSHENIGDIVHMIYRNDGVTTYLVVHKQSGTLLTYYKN